MAEKQKLRKSSKRGNQTPRQKPVEAEIVPKKPSMKTATDVISRFLWDDSLPRDRFYVGYLDRFDGIIEMPFESLDWRDLASVDNNTLAIPKHRIQYFKYCNRKVWDKRTRTDIVFGSTGYPLDIHGFISKVDCENFSFQDESLSRRNSAEETCRVDCTENIPDEEEIDISDRPNFFVAARISNPTTVANLKEVSDYIISRDVSLEECCINPAIYHLTLCILKLPSARQVSDTMEALNSVSSSALSPVTINLKELDNFRHRVLFARLDENENLMKLRQNLVDELSSRNVMITDRYSFVPHVTIAKLSRPVARNRHSNYIDQYLYLKFEDNEFGSQDVSSLYMCEMGSSRQDDGFYKCGGEVILK